MGIKGIALATSILCINGNSVYANLKDRKDLDCVKNTSFCIRCKGCSFYDVMHAKNCDVNRKVKAYLSDPDSKANKHSEQTGHIIDVNVKKSDICSYRNGVDVDFAERII